MPERDDNDELKPWRIPSYDRVFKQEHKLHHIGNWTLPRPMSLTWASWTLSAFLLTLFLTLCPVIGVVWSVIPFAFRMIVLPIVVGTAVTRANTQGRPALKFIMSWLLNATATGRRSLGRSVTDENREVKIDGWVWLARDQYSPVLRRATIIGPAKIEFRDRVWYRMDRKGETVTVLGVPPSQRPLHRRLASAGGKWQPLKAGSAIGLEADTRLEVRPL